MKIRNYLLCIAIGIAAFVFGINIVNVRQYFQSVFLAAEQEKEPEKESAATITYEELIYPPRNIEQAKIGIVEQMVTNIESEEKNFCQFDGGGNYYIIGDLPKGFKDFDTLSIVTRDYETEPEDVDGIPIPPKGYVITSKEFKFTRINIAGKQISFETQTKKGISYQFAGKFIDERKATDEETDYPELVGRLIKMRDGKKIAQSKVSFGIMCGC